MRKMLDLVLHPTVYSIDDPYMLLCTKVWFDK